MNILVIGGGGREHSIVWALERSKESERFIALLEMQESVRLQYAQKLI